MTKCNSLLFKARASANACRVKKHPPLRVDPHRLARVALSRAELSEWLARHPEEPSQWFAKEDVSQLSVFAATAKVVTQCEKED